MYRGKKIAVGPIAYNEERLIIPTLLGIPSYVDAIYVVDDTSTDQTAELVLNYSKTDPRVKLIQHKENKGPGQAIITSYLAGLEDDMDIVVTIGGDHQFDLLEMTSLIDPIIDGEADYVKSRQKFGERRICKTNIQLVINLIYTYHRYNLLQTVTPRKSILCWC